MKIIAEVFEKHIKPNFKGCWIDTSTTDEEEVKRLGPLAKAAGIDLLECPLSKFIQRFVEPWQLALA